MRARDLAVDYRTVSVDSDAMDAARLMAGHRLDEKHADRICRAPAGRRVGECLSHQAGPPPVADPDDTALEVAALMARVRSPLVAVAEKTEDGTHLLGVITASHLLHELLGEYGR